jgi:hypothetical protein
MPGVARPAYRHPNSRAWTLCQKSLPKQLISLVRGWLASLEWFRRDRPKFSDAALLPGRRSDRSRSPLRSLSRALPRRTSTRSFRQIFLAKGLSETEIRFGSSGFGRGVCFKARPRSADAIEDAPRVFPPTGKNGLKRLAPGFDGCKNVVAECLCDQVPELLAGMVRGTGGRQVGDSHVGGKPRIPVAQMGGLSGAPPKAT